MTATDRGAGVPSDISASQPSKDSSDSIATPSNWTDGVRPVNRRAFLESVTGRVEDVGTAILAMWCAKLGGGCALSLWSCLIRDDGLEEQDKELLVEQNSRTTSFTVERPNAARIRVVGLLHTEPHYALAKGEIAKRMESADVVLYEQGGFFERHFRDPALKNGLVSAPIEGKVTNVKGALGMFSALWACVYKGTIQFGRMLYFSRAALRDPDADPLLPGHRMRRRAVLTDALKMVAFLWGGAGGGQVLADATQAPNLMIADVSPLTDGRSMKMWSNALLWAERHPGKQIAVVVGDAHARAMRFYESTEVGRAAFAVKSPLYELLHLNALDWSTRSD